MWRVRCPRVYLRPIGNPDLCYFNRVVEVLGCSKVMRDKVLVSTRHGNVSIYMRNYQVIHQDGSVATWGDIPGME